MKSFAPDLSLKQSEKMTREWPVTYKFLASWNNEWSEPAFDAVVMQIFWRGRCWRNKKFH